jgi:4-alpha-glucanotransferase
MLRASLAWAGGIRIDHILGLQRLWVIPEGEKPTDGAYLHFPLADLLRLVTLEAHRHGRSSSARISAPCRAACARSSPGAASSA